MPAYIDIRASEFIRLSNQTILANLHNSYAADGFAAQYTTQTFAWEATVSLLKNELSQVTEIVREDSDWRILLELPLYRLRKRIDLLLVSSRLVLVVEIKVGEPKFLSTDKSQVQEYAMDLRDFHEHSSSIPLIPILWCTEAPHQILCIDDIKNSLYETVICIGKGQLSPLMGLLYKESLALPPIVNASWSNGAYRPVPSVIEAAMALFSGHGVNEIARADAFNLHDSAEEIVTLIRRAKALNKRYLIFLTGVPGSGKTLAGLQVVHRVHEASERDAGDVVYLSGNTPLVTVLREALTEDEYERQLRNNLGSRKEEVRSKVQSRIQHIMDFLRNYLTQGESRAPYERAIIFDEAQRAWNAAYGHQKFGRSASEPSLLLEIMSRHKGWSVIVGLIGGGQEINTGENGIAEWGDALRELPEITKAEWEVYGPVGMDTGINSSAHLGLGNLSSFKTYEVENLSLNVPMRSFRSPKLADWVSAVLEHNHQVAYEIRQEMDRYPILLTRSADVAKKWLRSQGHGERRYGLLSSSTNVRLRAYGYGVGLSANDGKDIAHWYLSPKGDVRSSYSLEITANEYTTQGLEIDFAGLCWGGDLLSFNSAWKTSKFSGTTWKAASGDRRRFILNSYRVLMTRAREGMVIWVPHGDDEDMTRQASSLDATSNFLESCGAKLIDMGTL